MKKFILFIFRFIHRLKLDEIFDISSQMTYGLIIAIFPFIIFLMTLIGFTPINGEEFLKNVSNIIPKAVYDLIESILHEVLYTRNIHILSFSLVITLYSASSGLRAIIKGLNKSYNQKETRNFIRVTLLTLALTAGLIFIIISTLILMLFGEMIGNYFAEKFNIGYMFGAIWNFIRYAIGLLMIFIIVVLLYKYAPSMRLKIKQVIPGAIFTTIGWFGATIGFSAYVTKYANYSKFYGSIGAVFILMTWLYISSIILLIGGQINAVLYFSPKREGNSISTNKKLETSTDSDDDFDFDPFRDKNQNKIK